MSSTVLPGWLGRITFGACTVGRNLACLSLASAAALSPAVVTASPVVQFFDLGVIDNSLVTRLEVRTPGDYTDIFNFEVSDAAYSFAAAVGSFGDPGPEFGVTVRSVTLFDANFNVLATDLDGNDGFLAEAVLPSAGLYRFAVNLSTLPAGGGYFVGILPVVTAVPTPASLPLVLAGLAVIAWGSARVRTRVQAPA